MIIAPSTSDGRDWRPTFKEDACPDDAPGLCTAMAALPTGGFVTVAPYFGSSYTVTAFTGNGSVEWSTYVSFEAHGASSATPSAVSVLENGDILVAGDVWTTSGYRFAMARLNENGTMDSVFGDASDGESASAARPAGRRDRISQPDPA